MRIRFIAIAGGLLLTACTGPPPPGSITYTTNSYSCCAEITGNNSWHAGQAITLHWVLHQGTTTDANTHQIVLSVSLTGPFASVDALKQATSQGTKPAGVRMITAAPISTTDRTIGEPASLLDLPADLPPGYYNLDAKAATGGGSAGGGAVIVVGP